MALIPQEDIAAIKAQADIVDIIGRYVSLTKKGKEYVGLCPFHQDHDPSMRVSPDKQFYKCFVCGAGGSVFTFVQKAENIPFPQAVMRVAEMIGYPLNAAKYSYTPKASPNQPYFDVMNLFTDYCSYELQSQDGAEALAYLRQRKFSDELIETFHIGFAPDAGRVLKFFRGKKLEETVLEKAGLLTDRDGKMDPVFFNRIVIPIEDAQGRTAAFTARTLPSSASSAKYINTTKTPVFEKGKTVFNYRRAREAAKKSGRLILVEGAMDVLGLEKAGIHEGIAMLGTACTPEQLDLIKRINVPVAVFYDSDKAGQRAVYKFGTAALEAGISFSVVNCSLNKDPDEIYIAHGAQALLQAVSRTVSFAEFAFEYLKGQYDLNNYEDKKAYAREMAALIDKACDRFEAPAYYARLREITGFEYESQSPVRKGPSSRKKTRKTSKGPGAAEPVPPVEPGRLHAEKDALAAMLFSRNCTQYFKDEVGFFLDPVCHTLSLYIYDSYRKNQAIHPRELVDLVEEDEVRNLLVELISKEDNVIYNEPHFRQALIKLKVCTLREKIEMVDKQIKESPDALKMPLMKEKMELIRQCNLLKNQRKEN